MKAGAEKIDREKKLIEKLIDPPNVTQIEFAH